jgi:hypothetical protein
MDPSHGELALSGGPATNAQRPERILSWELAALTLGQARRRAVAFVSAAEKSSNHLLSKLGSGADRDCDDALLVCLFCLVRKPLARPIAVELADAS